jgi:hypothetical protein
MSQKGNAVYGLGFQTGDSSPGECPIALVARAVLELSMSRETKATAAHNNNH